MVGLFTIKDFFFWSQKLSISGNNCWAFGHLLSAVLRATSFDWEHSPCNAFRKHISCFYEFSLGENILTDRSLTYYVKQVISWLLVLHLATWLEIYHTRQCCRIIFRRGHFTQKMLLHCHLQYPGSPSSHSLLEFLSGSHCWWLIIFFFWHWTIASTWPKPAAGPQPHLP